MTIHANRDRALRTGCTFSWEDDWDVGDHTMEFDCYPDGGPETCEMVALRNPFGTTVGALGCIDDADDSYRAQIEEDLAADYFYEIDRINVPGLLTLMNGG